VRTVPFIERVLARFVAPPRPQAVFGLTMRTLSGVRAGARGGSVRRSFVSVLDPGFLAPSFDRPNVADETALRNLIDDGKRALGLSGGTAALLLPEPCVRIFVLTAETLPASESEREAYFRWRVDKQMPLLPDDLRLAYDLPPGPGPKKVVVAAAREAVIREYEGLFLATGLKPGCVTIPSLSLTRLAGVGEGGNGILLNVERDYLSVFAVMDSEWILYRQKGIGSDSADVERTDLIVQEVENTVHFFEDRERKKVGRIWVRASDPEEAPEIVARLESALALSAGPIDYDAPDVWDARQKAVLAPLMGQLT
jgi:hypothetical protein